MSNTRRGRHSLIGDGATIRWQLDGKIISVHAFFVSELLMNAAMNPGTIVENKAIPPESISFSGDQLIINPPVPYGQAVEVFYEHDI